MVEALLALTAFLAPQRPAVDGAAALQISPLYRTRPVSEIAQPDFLNLAAVGRSDRTPREILSFAKQLERQAGRRPAPRDAPRPLDIDLLLHGDTVIAEPDLALPHPRLAARAFVLVPLAAVAPHLAVPPSGVTVGELLAALGPARDVVRVPWGDAAAQRLGLDPAVAAGRPAGPRGTD